MRIVLKRVLLPVILVFGLPGWAWSQDYIFNVRVKLENISPDVSGVQVWCRVCKIDTATVGACTQAAAGTPAGNPAPGAIELGFASKGATLAPSSTLGGPKNFDDTVVVSVPLKDGAIRSDVTTFSCNMGIAKAGGVWASLIASPQDIPVWARPDLNRPFTAIISGGL
jgi:hypothetical protein